jgi:hypothetical protein
VLEQRPRRAIWIVFGTNVTTKRIPGGAKVERACEQCGELAFFYEKEVTGTLRLYFIDVFDYRRHRVMACGSCGACYATDELSSASGASSRETGSSGSMAEQAARLAREVGSYADRAANALEARVARIFAPGPQRTDSAALHADPVVTADDEDLEGDAESLEERFRLLEEKARVRIEID